jgi:hypothetical protein
VINSKKKTPGLEPAAFDRMINQTRLRTLHQTRGLKLA